MENYTLYQKLAIVGLDGVDSVNMSVAKQAVLRGVAIAKTLEEWLPRLEECESDAFQSAFIPVLDSVKQMPKKELRVLEQEVAGVLHDIFTVSEQEKVHAKLTLHAAKQAVIAELLNAEVHRMGEIFGIKYLKFKKELFHNPYLQGINLMFPIQGVSIIPFYA